jgi:multisubunit Na+/H+ antiporter MnhF subunit
VHYYAFFSWLALGGAKLLYFVRQTVHPIPGVERRNFGSWNSGVRKLLRSPNFRAAEVGFWLSAALFVPWLPVFLAQAERVQAAYWIPRISFLSVPNTIARLFWGGVSNIAPWWALLASAVALMLVVIPLVRGRSFGDLVAAVSFVVPLMLSVLISLSPRSVYLDRYFLFASLGFILLVARTLSFLPRKLQFGALGLVTAFSLISIVQFWHSLDFPNHQGARAAAAFLNTEAAPDQPIIVSSSFVYFPMAFHLGCQTPGTRCQGGLNVRLYSETGQLAHFSGGPILTSSDVVGPEAFRGLGPVSADRDRLWVVDTTGFGGSRLSVPDAYALVSETHFPELFSYQGDIIVRAYTL